MQYRRQLLALSLLLVTSLFATGCSSSKDEQNPGGEKRFKGDKPVIFTVNYPLKYFAEAIGGDLIEVRFPVPQDVDPAFWNPDADAVSAYQNADLILTNGANYAKWLGKVSLPGSKLINTTKSVSDRYIEIKDAVKHTHGPKGEHSHGDTAFTTWLDPQIALAQARAVKDAIQQLLPDQAEPLGANLAKLELELQEIDKQLESITERIGNQPLIASHPVYQYFARRYGLNFESVHWEPDEFPNEESWAEFEELRKRHPAKWMIWEGQPDQKTVDKLHELGIACIVFDPCGNTPGDGGFLSVMNANIEHLARIAPNGSKPN
jgi:zinc transport system substrate-binding protein